MDINILVIMKSFFSLAEFGALYINDGAPEMLGDIWFCCFNKESIAIYFCTLACINAKIQPIIQKEVSLVAMKLKYLERRYWIIVFFKTFVKKCGQNVKFFMQNFSGFSKDNARLIIWEIFKTLSTTWRSSIDDLHSGCLAIWKT